MTGINIDHLGLPKQLDPGRILFTVYDLEPGAESHTNWKTYTCFHYKQGKPSTGYPVIPDNTQIILLSKNISDPAEEWFEKWEEEHPDVMVKYGLSVTDITESWLRFFPEQTASSKTAVKKSTFLSPDLLTLEWVKSVFIKGMELPELTLIANQVFGAGRYDAAQLSTWYARVYYGAGPTPTAQTTEPSEDKAPQPPVFSVAEFTNPGLPWVRNLLYANEKLETREIVNQARETFGENNFNLTSLYTAINVVRNNEIKTGKRKVLKPPKQVKPSKPTKQWKPLKAATETDEAEVAKAEVADSRVALAQPATQLAEVTNSLSSQQSDNDLITALNDYPALKDFANDLLSLADQVARMQRTFAIMAGEVLATQADKNALEAGLVKVLEGRGYRVAKELNGHHE